MKYPPIAVVVLAGLALTACQDQGNDRLAEKAKIEAQEAAKVEIETLRQKLQMEKESAIASAYERGKKEAEATVDVENGNLSQKIKAMESDLTSRHKFYQQTKGVYEGTLSASDEEFRIRLTLAPSLAPVHSSRTRTAAELEYDLTNLNFNVQVVQWKGGMPSTAVGCRVQGVRPDITAQEMTIASQDCPNLYRVSFKNQSLDGFVQPTTNANIYPFQAEKKP